MVNYLTLAVCMLSAAIFGGLAVAVWLIFREKDLVEQIKDRLPKNMHNFINTSPSWETTVTEERHTSTAVPGGYKCPVENCRIQRRHSHTEAFIRRVKEK